MPAKAGVWELMCTYTRFEQFCMIKSGLLGLTIYGYFIKFSQAERLWEEIKYNKRLKI